MTWLLRYLRPVAGRLAILLLLLLASTGVQLVNPQIVQRFIDTAADNGIVSSLLTLAGIYLVLAALNQVLTVAVSYLATTSPGAPPTCCAAIC